MNFFLSKLNILRHNRLLVISLVCFIVFSYLVKSVFATPIYDYTNVITDPTCEPTDVDCTVSNFPDDTGQANEYLRTDGAGGFTWESVTAAVDIGSAIASGTSGAVLYVDGSGQLAEDPANFSWDDTNKFLGIGTNAPINVLHVEHTASDPLTAFSTVSGSLTVSNSLNNNQTYSGGSFSVEKTDNNNESLGYLVGVVGTSKISGSGATALHAGVIGNATTDPASAVNQSSSVGVYGLVNHYGSGVITNAVGLSGNISSPGSGSITNAYGLRFSAPTIGTSTNYGVYISGSADNYFQGNVGIGDDTPTVALDVTGAIAATTTISAGTIVDAGTQYNIAGAFFGNQNTTDLNLSIGFGSGTVSVGDYNTFVGIDAGSALTTGYSNTFLGYQAGYANTDGWHNVFVGLGAGAAHITAGDNVFVGSGAGGSDTGGSGNTFIGKGSGSNNTTGLGNTAIGLGARMTNATDEHGIAIGQGAVADSYQFALPNDVTSWKFRGDPYTLPLDDSAGAFVSDGSGSITWETVAISVENSTSLFSTGVGAGTGSNTTDSIFLGVDAGDGATGASEAIFIGLNAGSGAVNASRSNFIGRNAGFGADNATDANFIGGSAGSGATDAVSALFFGNNSGQDATDAVGATFVGNSAGFSAENAAYSTFIGGSAGSNAATAKNSIFIGFGAGASSTVDNTAVNVGDSCDTLTCSSIAIGYSASPGAYSNSIALGNQALNTAANQLMIGSGLYPINDMVITGAGFTTCSVNTITGVGISCSSDERLKTNITDLDTNTLAKVLQIRTVNFNWINNDDTTNKIGFLAQNLEQYYPELVSTASNGYLQVNYAGMTPILVEAIRELDLKISGIQNFTDETFLGNIRAWLASATNGIESIFTREIVTDRICVKDDQGQTCLTRSQLDLLLNGNGGGSILPPENDPEDNPPVEEGGDEGIVGGEEVLGGDDIPPPEPESDPEPLVEEPPIE